MTETMQKKNLEAYANRTRTPVLNKGTPDEMRATLRAYTKETFAIEESLFATLASDAAFYIRADALRHPLVFYYGHTPTFYINKLVAQKILPSDTRVNAEFEAMFLMGVDEMTYDDLEQVHYNWPKVDEVRAYRKTVLDLVLNVIDTLPIKIPIVWEDPAWIVLMGIEHQRLHIETSSVLIRQLPIEHVRPIESWQPCQTRSQTFDSWPLNEMIQVDGGSVKIGKSDEGQYYGWDDEYGHIDYDIHPFQASQQLVSNGEFLAFVRDDGYLRKQWWVTGGGGAAAADDEDATEDDGGWQWLTKTGATLPRFWRRDEKAEGQYRLRLLAEEVPMPWDWPVVVNNYEATAFCLWMSAQRGVTVRLPKEAELVYLENKELPATYPDWNDAVANVDLAHYGSSCAVNVFRHGRFYDLIGNVWQHTSTALYALPGFKVHAAYPDFSAYQFDGKHLIMRGGSWVTMGQAATASYRTSFRRHFYQHCGFRYVTGDNAPKELTWCRPWAGRIAEKLTAQYRCAADGQLEDPVIDTALRSIRDLSDQPLTKALDVGCSVGGRCFQLAKHFNQVVGLDWSTESIRAAVALQESGIIQFDTGSNLSSLTLQGLHISTDTAKRVEFHHGDACNIKHDFFRRLQPPVVMIRWGGHAPRIQKLHSGFDLVLACDVLDRLYDPCGFLRQIHERINPSGVLVISCAYDWRRDKTTADKWLTSYRPADGESSRRRIESNLDALRMILEGHFELLSDPTTVPAALQSRQNQSCPNEVTIWRRCTQETPRYRTVSWLM